MTIAELRKRSNDFVKNLDVHIADIVEHNPALINLNRQQLKLSRTSEGKPLVNRMTGSARYSRKYARFKGYQYPDLYLTGAFHREMDVFVKEPDQYFLTSFDEKTDKLVDMYGEKIFGIEDKDRAKAVVVPKLQEKFKNLVLR